MKKERRGLSYEGLILVALEFERVKSLVNRQEQELL